MRKLFDPAEVLRAWGLLVAPASVHEVRILDGADRPGIDARRGTWAGWFDDPAALVSSLARLHSWSGVYVTLNPCDPVLLARRANRLEWAKRGDLTTDGGIVARRQILIDLDAVRPAGVSATDQELGAAMVRATVIRTWLTTEGFPAPLLACSGNGGHLLVRCDLPAASDLPKRLLEMLAARFDDAAVHVDRSVHNPARISKLYGTLACKGDAVPGRPHRMAQVIDAGAGVAVPASHIENVIAKYAPAPAPAPVKPERPAPRPGAGASTAVAGTAVAGTGGRVAFDAVAFVRAAGHTLGEAKTAADGGAVHEFERCPCPRGLDDRAAFLTLAPSGAVGLGCQHATCDYSRTKGAPGEHWKAYRRAHDPAYDPDAPAAPDPSIAAERAAAWAAKAAGKGDAAAGLAALVTGGEAPAQPAAAPLPKDGGRDPDGRLVIDARRDLRDLRDVVIGELARRPDLYLTHGQIARCDDGAMQALDGGALDGVIVDACRFVEYVRDRQTGEWTTRTAALPPRVLAMIERLAPEHAITLRPVDVVTRAPFFARDGRPVLGAGYDAGSRVLAVDVPAVHPQPETDGPAALRWLADLVGDFPFESEAERSNFLGALLVPMVRPLIRGPVPLVVIEANKQGTGKTLLANLVQVIYGLPAEAVPLPSQEDEIKKQALSVLLDARAVHVWDNIRHAIASASLEALLTSEVYSDRILGKSKTIRAFVRGLFIATVNNARASVDIARRTLRVRLVTAHERPEERADVRRPDLLAWVAAHRGDVLARLVQVAGAWVAAGMPRHDTPRFGSFEGFASVIGSILAESGDRAFLGNLGIAKADATMGDEFDALIVAWDRELPPRGVKCGQLWTIANRLGILAHVMGSGADGSQVSRLGHALQVRRDSVIEGRRLLVEKDPHTRQTLYGIELVRH